MLFASRGIDSLFDRDLDACGCGLSSFCTCRLSTAGRTSPGAGQQAVRGGGGVRGAGGRQQGTSDQQARGLVQLLMYRCV